MGYTRQYAEYDDEEEVACLLPFAIHFVIISLHHNSLSSNISNMYLRGRELHDTREEIYTYYKKGEKKTK